MDTHEPCQVRKEAALSGPVHVPRGSLTWAGDKSNACVRLSEKGARHEYANSSIRLLDECFFYVKEMEKRGFDVSVNDIAIVEGANHAHIGRFI